MLYVMHKHSHQQIRNTCTNAEGICIEHDMKTIQVRNNCGTHVQTVWNTQANMISTHGQLWQEQTAKHDKNT